jgi:hypothetical protein
MYSGQTTEEQSNCTNRCHNRKPYIVVCDRNFGPGILKYIELSMNHTSQSTNRVKEMLIDSIQRMIGLENRMSENRIGRESRNGYL